MDESDYTNEIWKTIPFAPDYAVSDHGRVKRVAAGDPRSHTYAGQVLKPRTDRDGYVLVSLFIRGKGRGFGVHRLMAFAFHGAPPTPKHQAAHWNGCPSHNSLDNIRWATTQENGADAARHGRRKGERSAQVKLTDAEVAHIRESRSGGEPGVSLARRLGVSASLICRIWKGAAPTALTRRA